MFTVSLYRVWCIKYHKSRYNTTKQRGKSKHSKVGLCSPPARHSESPLRIATPKANSAPVVTNTRKLALLGTKLSPHAPQSQIMYGQHGRSTGHARAQTIPRLMP
ncbi:hypothetical protein BDV06DRAFT_203728 [Aspergillus oleicola]